jgi:hypothetical protein
MITLKQNTEVEIYQVELALKVKSKQSPFISILILAQEFQGITPEILQSNLLVSLPLRACKNLLIRLANQGYFIEYRQFENKYYTVEAKDYMNPELKSFFEKSQFYAFGLTELGLNSAKDKSFWIGEKGVYNVFVSKSSLIEQRIIRTEKVERAEDNRSTNISRTPNEITQYENQILNINKTEVLIEDVEEKCFQLKSMNGILEIQSKENETVLKYSNNSQLLYQTDMDIEENIIKEELLAGCSEFAYDEDKKSILTDFNKNNLSFKRKVKIGKPIFEQNLFNQVELENIVYIPSNKQNAKLWYWELLYKNMNDYFMDENSFQEFATDLLKPFQLHYNLEVPHRMGLSELFSERDDAFYQIAKLETIDYLNY